MEMINNGILILAFIYWISSGKLMDALKMTKLVVPRYADLRESAELSCNFDLENEKLYSVKWYKDEFEFFRYMPDNNPNIQTFLLPGINLDLSRSNMTAVTLNPLNLNSTGTYRCEVSTDRPSFDTVADFGNLTVIAYPDGEPSIDGLQSRYSVGNDVTVNCTSSKSYPVADLTWYINNEKADSWVLESYPVVMTRGPLYSKALGLRFKLEERHFKRKDPVELKCIAKIEDLPPWERKVLVQRVRLHNGYSNSATFGYFNDGYAIGPDPLITMTVMIFWITIKSWWPRV